MRREGTRSTHRTWVSACVALALLGACSGDEGSSDTGPDSTDPAPVRTDPAAPTTAHASALTPRHGPMRPRCCTHVGTDIQMNAHMRIHTCGCTHAGTFVQGNACTRPGGSSGWQLHALPTCT